MLSLADVVSSISIFLLYEYSFHVVCIFISQVNDNLRRSLDSLQEGDTLGVLIDKKSRLHLLINGEDLGPIAQAIPARRFAVLDLYGCCEEVSIVTADHGERGRVSMEETKIERSSGN